MFIREAEYVYSNECDHYKYLYIIQTLQFTTLVASSGISVALSAWAPVSPVPVSADSSPHLKCMSVLFCWVQRHIFCPDLWCFTPSKEEKTKIPGTSGALKSGYPEEIVHSKLATRKKMLHWETATGKELCIENWQPEKLLYCFLVNCLMDLLFVNFFRKFLLVPGF